MYIVLNEMYHVRNLLPKSNKLQTRMDALGNYVYIILSKVYKHITYLYRTSRVIHRKVFSIYECNTINTS